MKCLALLLKIFIVFYFFFPLSSSVVAQTFKKVLQIPTDSTNVPLYIDGMKPTKDGGFLLAGTQRTRIGNPTGVYIVKVSRCNQIQWSQSISKPEKDSSNDLAYRDMAIQKNGDILILSKKKEIIKNRAYSINLVTRITSKGRVVWNKKIEGTRESELTKIICLPNNNFALFGTIKNSTTKQACLMSCNQNGTIRWAKTYNNFSFNTFDVNGIEIKKFPEGGFIFSMRRFAFRPGLYFDNSYLVKTDKLGNPQWGKDLGEFYCHLISQGLNKQEWIGVRATQLFGFQKNGELNWVKSFEYQVPYKKSRIERILDANLIKKNNHRPNTLLLSLLFNENISNTRYRNILMELDEDYEIKSIQKTGEMLPNLEGTQAHIQLKDKSLLLLGLESYDIKSWLFRTNKSLKHSDFLPIVIPLQNIPLKDFKEKHFKEHKIIYEPITLSTKQYFPHVLPFQVQLENIK